MNVIVRFYWQHDLDLVALAAHPEFDMVYWIKEALAAEVRGTEGFFIPLPPSIPYSIDLESNYVHIQLYSDEDEDIISYLIGLRTGFRNSAIKLIFRKYLEQPFFDVFFDTETYRAKARGNPKSSSVSRRKSPRRKSLVARTLSGNNNPPADYTALPIRPAQSQVMPRDAALHDMEQTITSPAHPFTEPPEIRQPDLVTVPETPDTVAKTLDLSKEKPSESSFDLFGAIEDMIK